VPGASIAGRVTAGGAPTAGACVSLYGNGLNFGDATTEVRATTGSAVFRQTVTSSSSTRRALASSRARTPPSTTGVPPPTSAPHRSP
jgi:hypothetical protein